MFRVNYRQNITISGYNPFMMGCFNPRLNFVLGTGCFSPNLFFGTGCFNPRLNYFLGMAAATAVPPMPLFGAYNYSSFNPYMTMNYANPFAFNGLGSYNYQTPTFNYIPQIIAPQNTYTNPFLSNITNLTTNNTDNTQPEKTNNDNNAQKTGSQGIKLIKNFESCSLKACKAVPTEKEYTIGWGHYGVPQGTVWTQQQADDQLEKDLKKCEQYVNQLGRNWTQNQFDALVSFTYNCGPKNLQSLVKNRNNEQIAQAMLEYNKAGGNVLRGLTRRRQEERNMFLGRTSGLNSVA